jgi:hypothetical protein
MSGELDIGMGGTSARHPFQNYMDFSHHFLRIDHRWFTRKPIPKAKFDQFLIAFSYPVWVATLSTFLLLSLLFAVVYKVYTGKVFAELGFTGHLNSYADFVLLTFSSLVQAQPINWFPKFSAGDNIFDIKPSVAP